MNKAYRLSLLVPLLGFLLLYGCMVGPKYNKPTVPLAPSYKESPPASFKEQDGWKDWFTWPSRFWAVGPTFSETIFDAGR